jgi:hypothetical protein
MHAFLKGEWHGLDRYWALSFALLPTVFTQTHSGETGDLSTQEGGGRIERLG